MPSYFQIHVRKDYTFAEILKNSTVVIVRGTSGLTRSKFECKWPIFYFRSLEKGNNKRIRGLRLTWFATNSKSQTEDFSTLKSCSTTSRQANIIRDEKISGRFLARSEYHPRVFHFPEISFLNNLCNMWYCKKSRHRTQAVIFNFLLKAKQEIYQMLHLVSRVLSFSTLRQRLARL